MVKEIVRNDGRYYVCEECGFAYEDKAWAENVKISVLNIMPVLLRLPATPFK